MYKNLWCALTLAVGLPFAASAERIIVAGDSITGHSKNLGGKVGYFYQFNQALQEAGVTGVELIPLGGSGQSVSSWRNVVKNSREKEEKLDIKDYTVKTELDRGADTLVIFLGMNDTLAPYTSLERLDQWKKQYQQLIDDLKARTKFTKLVLASPTMCTENPETYKNRMMAGMDQLVDELVKENNAVKMESFQEFLRYWKLGRMSNPNFRMTLDFVHGNQNGHFAITTALLKAVGQEKAAQLWYEKNRKNLGAAALGEAGMLLYTVNSEQPGTLVVHGEFGNFKAEQIETKLPTGWSQQELTRSGETFTLTLKLPAALPLQSTVKVTARDAGGKELTRELTVAAPWLVAAGLPGPRWFNGKDFDVEKQLTPLDQALAASNDYRTAPVDAKGTPANWLVYYPTGEVTGGTDPNSVDFASFADARAFDQGLMIRYLHSEQGGKARLKLSRRIFAGSIGATVYLNGQRVFGGFLDKGEATAEVELKPGWNLLAAKCSHVTWQFQLSVALEQLPGGAPVTALTYAVTPQPEQP